MKTNIVARAVKAVAAVLAVVGIAISPELQEEITTGMLAVYAVFSAIQAKWGE